MPPIGRDLRLGDRLVLKVRRHGDRAVALRKQSGRYRECYERYTHPNAETQEILLKW